MKKFKNQNAITLIALVITIVVLLILAGVALSLVVGEDGITNRAITAAKTQDIAGAKEKLELLAASYAGDFYEAKYVTGDQKATSLGDYVASKFSPGIFEEDFTLAKDASNSRKITISSKNYADNSATCTISDDGQVIWEGAVPVEEGTLIDDDVNYKGYFADLDGNGKIEVDKDGVIYVDLLAQSGEEDEWFGTNGAYTIPTAGIPESYNKYYMSKEKTSIDGQTGYGEQKMIKLASSSENPRFYVMALQDFSVGSRVDFFWYKNAVGDMAPSDTSGDFGTGKENTKNMLDIWNGENGKMAYGDKYSGDLWNHIKEQYNAGWFVPSRAEWCAFGKTFNVTSVNFGSFGCTVCYWSSSQCGNGGAWMPIFSDEIMLGPGIDEPDPVRLSSLF